MGKSKGYSATVRHSGNVAIIDLAGVEYLDSSCLGEMSSAYIAVGRAGGKLKLLNPQPKVHNLLQVTRMYTLFDSFPNESTAVASFH